MDTINFIFDAKKNEAKRATLGTTVRTAQNIHPTTLDERIFSWNNSHASYVALNSYFLENRRRESTGLASDEEDKRKQRNEENKAVKMGKYWKEIGRRRIQEMLHCQPISGSFHHSFSTLIVVQSVKEFTLRISIQACMYEQFHFVFFKAVDPRLWSSASFVISVIIPPMPFASIIRSATTRACLWGFSYLSWSYWPNTDHDKSALTYSTVE